MQMNESTQEIHSKGIDEEVYDKNMGKLLQHAWVDPVPQNEFKQQLLQKLKLKQKSMHIKPIKRVQKIIFSFTAAAAIAIMLMSSQFFTTNTQTKDINGNTSEVISRANVQTITAIDAIQVAENNIWKSIKAETKIELKEGMKIRPEALELAGFATEFGALFLMDSDAELMVVNGKIEVEKGDVFAKVLPVATESETLQVRGKQFALQPGTLALLQVTVRENLTEAGQPVPTIVVLSGAIDTDSAARRQLQPNRIYSLYETPTGAYPSIPLEMSEKDDLINMANTILARSFGMPRITPRR